MGALDGGISCGTVGGPLPTAGKGAPSGYPGHSRYGPAVAARPPAVPFGAPAYNSIVPASGLGEGLGPHIMGMAAGVERDSPAPLSGAGVEYRTPPWVGGRTLGISR